MPVVIGRHERTARLVTAAVVAAVVGLVAGMAVTAAGAQASSADAPPELVILARSDNPADALSAGPVGGVLGAAVLLTPSSSLHPAAADAIKSIDPDLVILAGGPVALSAEVELAVINLGYPTQRAAGGDRHETAAIIAGLLAEYSTGRPVLTGAPVTDEVIPGLNAARLGGKQAGDFLGTNERAVDSARLEGKSSAAFAGAGHDHLGQTWTGSGGLDVHAAVPGAHEAAVAGVNTDTSGGASSRVGLYGEATGAGCCVYDPGYPHQPAGVLGRVGTSQGVGVVGSSGDLTDLWAPVGNVGVAGFGASRGMYGSARSSYGLYATSLDWYGIYGRTSRSDNNYGLYTPDNLFAANVTSSSGTFATVMQNDGSTSLEPGDVVAFSGLGEPPTADANPAPAVTQTSTWGDPAVAGVVLSRFDPEAAALDPDDPNADGVSTDPTPDGPVRPGSYLLVAVSGPAQVNITTEDLASLVPGDLVTPGQRPGQAGALAQVRAETRTADAPAVVLGKVLGPAQGSSNRLWIYVGVN